jgi:hypothetical protein
MVVLNSPSSKGTAIVRGMKMRDIMVELALVFDVGW